MQAGRVENYVRNAGSINFDGNRMWGWAIGADTSELVELAVIVNGVQYSQITADLFRPDIQKKNMHPNGRCGFDYTFPESLKLKPGDQVHVRPLNAEFGVSNSPHYIGDVLRPKFEAGVESCLIAGHSHLSCIQGAYGQGRTQGLHALFLQLHQYMVPGYVLDLKVLQIVKEWAAEFAGQAAQPNLIICPWGNQHTALGLLRHPRLFDFVLPEEVERPIIPEAEVIPYEAVRRAMEERCIEPIQIAELFSTLGVERCFWLEPPPPIGSEEHIRRFADSFRDAIDSMGTGPAEVHYKLWKLQSNIFRDWCVSHGWEYISAPARASDPRGFLVKEGWTNWEPAHANEWYGQLVLDKVASCLAVKNHG